MVMLKTFYSISSNRELSLLYPNNATWNIEKFGQEFLDSHTTSWRTNYEKVKIHKTLIKVRFAKINPPEKSAGSQLARLNPHEMLKKWLAKINQRENFSQGIYAR